LQKYNIGSRRSNILYILNFKALLATLYRKQQLRNIKMNFDLGYLSVREIKTVIDLKNVIKGRMFFEIHDDTNTRRIVRSVSTWEDISSLNWNDVFELRCKVGWSLVAYVAFVECDINQIETYDEEIISFSDKVIQKFVFRKNKNKNLKIFLFYLDSSFWKQKS